VTTRQTSPDRVRQFSDGVFAVLITILVLQLRPPKAASFSADLLMPRGLPQTGRSRDERRWRREVVDRCRLVGAVNERT
jgi:hypothetical protein